MLWILIIGCWGAQSGKGGGTECVQGDWFPDQDGDGYGTDTEPVWSCEPVSGHAPRSGDCDDSNPSISPLHQDLCDARDNNCDGQVDEDAASTTSWYPDEDGDGYGTDGPTVQACMQPEGYAAEPTDCDDEDAGIHPGWLDPCDEIDNDCDGRVDEQGQQSTHWYLDQDGDGFGRSDVRLNQCDQPDGYVRLNRDCDDADPAVNPGATEVCSNGDDEDCDGRADCEDGDCFRDAACLEDCDTPEDDDGDGAVNCQDDDCWGTVPCPLPPKVSIAGGRYRAWRTDHSYGHGEHLRLYSVSGTLTAWNTAATATNTCRWSVGNANLGWSHAGTSPTWGVGAVARRSFTVEPGCGTSSTGFLPASIVAFYRHWDTAFGPMVRETYSGGWSAGLTRWYVLNSTSGWWYTEYGTLSARGPTYITRTLPSAYAPAR